jgi:3-hydroxyacyl-[acyl-carrier-protein] dehydratase
VSRRVEDSIPHRRPFLWIEQVLELEPGARCVASQRLDPAEPIFGGHFPDNPLLPGAILIEASAQTAGVMLGARLEKPPAIALLAAVHNFKFVRPVKPGDVIEIETCLKLEALGMAVVSAIVRVGSDVVAMGEISVVCR